MGRALVTLLIPSGNLSGILVLAAAMPFGIWSFIITIYSLSNQQEIRKRDAIGLIIVPSLLIAIIMSVILFVFAYTWFASFSSAQTSLVGTESASTQQEEFIELTSESIEIVDASCVADFAYYVDVRNLDPENEIDTSEIVIEVDSQTVSEVFWEPSTIPARGISTATVSEFVGDIGSAHRIKATEPSGQQHLSVALC